MHILYTYECTVDEQYNSRVISVKDCKTVKGGGGWKERVDGTVIFCQALKN